ncbi:hypothetical protein ILYODFUR_034712, partial [Ilyodon furcidens]
MTLMSVCQQRVIIALSLLPATPGTCVEEVTMLEYGVFIQTVTSREVHCYSSCSWAELANGLDPYEHSEWTTNLNELPGITLSDVFGYIVCAVSPYAYEQFRNYMSPEAHLHFTNGWVQDLQIFRVNDHKTI